MKKLILIIIFLLTLCGCQTTKKVEREIVTEIMEMHDTIRDVQVEIRHDSIYMHDSIIVTKDSDGKIVYKEKYVYRDLWHEAEVKVVHDSIVVYRNEKESEHNSKEVVEKKPWYLPLAVWGSMGLLVCLLFYAIKKL